MNDHLQYLQRFQALSVCGTKIHIFQIQVRVHEYRSKDHPYDVIKYFFETSVVLILKLSMEKTVIIVNDLTDIVRNILCCLKL